MIFYLTFTTHTPFQTMKYMTVTQTHIKRKISIIHYSTILAILVSFVLFFAPTVHAEKFSPLFIYQGSISKNSFNVAIHAGIERFVKKTGEVCKEVVIGTGITDYMNALDKYSKAGFNPIFLLYGNHIKELPSYIRKYPNTRFIALGVAADEPNLFSLDFAEHEGSFLAGALAAMTSQSKTIGFISVSDLPLMRRFSCGYEQGAKYIDPDITVLVHFTGTYLNAWFDGKATGKAANALMDTGADVIYQAAGGAGTAVLEAVAKRGKLGIGVDRNQNGLYPGHVLTSMIKRTDMVIYAALMHARRGIWRDSIKHFGVVQNAVSLAFDENNAALVTPEMRQRIERITSKIALGEIQIHDYVTDNTCPSLATEDN